MKTVRIINKSRGDAIVGERIEVPDTTPLLFQGLLGKSKLDKERRNASLSLCSIHCIGMKFALMRVLLIPGKR